MKKVKFKCEQCKVTVKRTPDRIVKSKSKKYCSDNCKGKHDG